MKTPSIYEVEDLAKYVTEKEALVEISKRWMPARPLGLPTVRARCRAAWMVFTGKADAVIWPGDQ